MPNGQFDHLFSGKHQTKTHLLRFVCADLMEHWSGRTLYQSFSNIPHDYLLLGYYKAKTHEPLLMTFIPKRH